MSKSYGGCIAIGEDESIVCGYSDGFIRAFKFTTKPYSPILWEIVNAHKGYVTAVFVVLLFIILES